jgi:hypothetical protein
MPREKFKEALVSRHQRLKPAQHIDLPQAKAAGAAR